MEENKMVVKKENDGKFKKYVLIAGTAILGGIVGYKYCEACGERGLMMVKAYKPEVYDQLADTLGEMTAKRLKGES